MASRTILIADPNVEVVRSLKSVLKDDYEVIAVRDGSRALEQAILKYPDLILFERHCPLIGATQFVRILRSNPRTEEIPIIILSDAPLAAQNVPGFLQGVLVKPLNLDEVRVHIASVLRKVEAVQRADSDDGAVSGSLEQISMPDLLQIFSVNRRTGCLQLTRAAGHVGAEVYVRDGRIEEALVTGTRGEKALYRLLGWNDGHFSFLAGRRAPSVSLQSSTDSLLMEGMRQIDELERLRVELPVASAQIERLVPTEGLPEGLHPVTAEIVSLVEFYPRVGDLVDRAHEPDLEVYLALRSLLAAGILRAVAEGEATVQEAVLTGDETVELRGRLRRAGLAPLFQATPKIAVLATQSFELRQLCMGLSHIPGWQGADLERLYRLGFGSIGTLHLDASIAVNFYLVSNEARLLPLAFGLSAGTIVGIVLGVDGFSTLAAAVNLVENERRAGLLIVRARGEAPVAGGARRVDFDLDAWKPASAYAIVRAALTQAAGREGLRGGAL